MNKKKLDVDDSDIEKSIHEEKIKMNYVFEELKKLPLHKKDKKINNHILITKINKNNGNNSNKPNNNTENNNENKDKIDNQSPIWGLMLTMQENLNMRIGIQKWKRYIRASFWNNVSTPINFTITLFTALSAGQTGTQSQYLSNNQLFYILFLSFILSTINTFFKLKDKAKKSHELLNSFEPFGSAYEDIYFQQILNNEDVRNRLKKYQKLQKELNEFLIEEEEISRIDYISDFLFIIVKYFCFCCFSNKLKQINIDERYWVLDGAPNIKKRSYNIDMNNIFIHDFSKIDSNYRDRMKRIFYNDNEITSL
jgi:hypothetical protein